MDFMLLSVCLVIFTLTAICNFVQSCDTKIPHGHVAASCETFCLYWCEPGYEALAYPYLECEGKWRPWDEDLISLSEDDFCRPKSCPDVTVPNGNLLECLGTVGSTCSYVCNLGFKQKSSQISCLHSTEWNENPHTLCTNPKQCPYDIPRGALNISCHRNHGDICSYTCDHGMLTSDPTRTLTCKEDSTWDTPLEHMCTTIRCPERIPNGHVMPSCERGFKDSCHFFCDEGFEKSPNIFSLTCNESAKWEWFNQEENVLCLDETQLCPATIENGKISDYCARSIGSQCGFTCDKHCFRNHRVLKLTCNTDLTWKPAGRLCWDCGVGTCDTKIPHGSVMTHCQDTCFYYCDAGYENSLTLSILKCSTNNKWVPAKETTHVTEEELCRPKSCPNITVPNGNLLSCPGKVDTECTYSCNSGYRQKSSQISCLKTTKWNEIPHALCTNNMQCPYEIPRGTLDLSCNRNPGDTCNYTCDEGQLAFDQSRKLICNVNATWDKPLNSICTVIRCPDRISHGSLPSYCGREYEDVCYDYSCDVGYEKPKRHSLKCNKFAQWEIAWSWLESQEELCTPKHCPWIYIPNGNLSTCDMTVGSACDYTCKPGYDKSSNSITCLAIQTWHKVPQALCANETQCPFEIPRGDLDTHCDRNPGDVCNYTCHEGMLAANTSRTLTCGSNSSWDVPLESICTVIKCPSNISKAVISPTCKQGYNDVCLYYSCPSGYDKPSIALTFKCNQSALWSIEWNRQSYLGDLCIARSCPELDIPNAHRVKCLAKVDSVCRYVCYEGYRQKSESVICLPTAKWNLDLHTLCSNSDQCEEYKIPNGTLTPNCGRNPGDRCTYTCNDGMMPVSDRIRCRDETSTWDRAFDTLCRVFECPGKFPGGSISQNCGRRYNDVCSDLQCNAGFEEVPKAYLRCNESAQWENYWRDGADVCLDKGKMCPKTIKNGTIHSSCQRTVGTKCGYSCDRYCHKRSAVSSLTCLSYNTWDSNADLACYNCNPPLCPTTISNGYISLACDRRSGTNCNMYYCNSGCRRTGLSLYCSSNGYWVNMYSACDCDYYESTTPYTEYEGSYSTSRSQQPLVLAIVGIILFVAVVGVIIYCCKKQQQGRRETTQPTSDAPVVYHAVTTNTQVVTNGRQDNPPNYNSLGPSEGNNIEPLLSEAWAIPSASPGSHVEVEGGLTPGEPSSGIDAFSPPPSYSEVVGHPDKYQTERE